jgi:hypothetical protein
MPPTCRNLRRARPFASVDAGGAISREPLRMPGTVRGGAGIKPGEPGEALYREALDAGDVSHPSPWRAAAPTSMPVVRSAGSWSGFQRLPPTLAELSRQLTPTLPPAVSDRYFADDDRLSLTGMSSRLAGTRPHANQCNPTRILRTCHPPLPQRSRLHINLLPKIVHEDDRSIIKGTSEQ